MNAHTPPILIEISAAVPPFRCILEVPASARSIIVFAHGSDSSNVNPRNILVARALFERGFAVLLPDLSGTDGRSRIQASVSERGSMRHTATRLVAIIDWLADNPSTRGLRVGLFGSRSGAASAMVAAAVRPSRVYAVVSRGGRPDLAEDLLLDVQAPTLMLVGSRDKTHIDHNRKACEKMRRKPMLELIQGATHLFGEPGKLEQVASISSRWFQQTLAQCG